jgi:hypothetical protein
MTNKSVTAAEIQEGMASANSDPIGVLEAFYDGWPKILLELVDIVSEDSMSV